jgi:hypothetical protein
MLILFLTSNSPILLLLTFAANAKHCGLAIDTMATGLQVPHAVGQLTHKVDRACHAAIRDVTA